MSDRIREPIRLNEAQVRALDLATDGGRRDFPDGYALVHDWIKDNPAAQADGTVFWFEQARGINNDDSLSARFIRRHTENGLDAAKVPLSDRLPMQDLSNMIAERVTRELLEHGKVPPLANILHNDIRVAIEEGSVPLGGWGGSFYYYDMPFKPDEKDMQARPGLQTLPGEHFPRKPDGSYHTVGDEIEARGERDLLVQTSAKTVADMMIAGEISWNNVPEMLETNLNAGMPFGMKVEVVWLAREMVVDHHLEPLREIPEALRQIPDNLQQLLEQQRRNLWDRGKEKLDDLINPLLPGIPRVSAQEPSANGLEQQMGPVKDGVDAPFSDIHVNRAYAALVTGDSQELDRVAIAFSQSPEGQQMAQLGDQLLAQQQLLEQQQLQAQHGPVMGM
jgi:hypothetical protein